MTKKEIENLIKEGNFSRVEIEFDKDKVKKVIIEKQQSQVDYSIYPPSMVEPYCK